MTRAARWLGLGALLLACRSEDKPLPPPPASAGAAAPVPSAPATASSERVDLIQLLSGCELEHEGRLYDFGGNRPPPFRAFAPPGAEPPPSIDREGNSFERVTSRELQLDFWLDRPASDIGATIRLYPGSARWLHVSIDDKRLGSQKLVPGEIRSLSFAPAAAELTPGRHRLKLRFAGAARGAKEPQADVDWVRIGAPPDNPQTYAAPTLTDVVSDVVLDGVPKRSIVLRAPATARCFLKPSPDARLRLSLGFWGAGRGTAEVALVSDDHPERILLQRKLSGGDGATFSSATLDLGTAGGELVALELRARDGSRGGRVVFGDPVLIRQAPEVPRVPRARHVVLVVLSSLDRARLPPWSNGAVFTTLGELGKRAVTFSQYRAPASAPAGVVASLLTGVAPAVHGLIGSRDALRARLTTLAETVKEAGGRTAFFTGTPTTFAPFGFPTGFDTFDAISPVLDLPATEPLVRAAQYLDRELTAGGAGSRLLVVQTRGAHPPWDLTREETQALKPQEYGGILDPRRSGIVLGALRGKQKQKQRRLADDDWVRLRAFHDAAVLKQDAALGRLIEVLKQRGAWDDTLLVVTSDAALGQPPEIPFDPEPPLGEDRMALPLVVRFPGDALGGRESGAPVSAEDVAATMLRALGLDSVTARGEDVFARASGTAPLTGALDVAIGREGYSARLGTWVLRGAPGKVPRLCAVDIDPACALDALDQKPLAARALWLATFEAGVADARAARNLGPARSAEIDPDTLAALTVWGDVP